MERDKLIDTLVVIAIAICAFLFVQLGIFIAKGNDCNKVDKGTPCIAKVEAKKYG